MQAQNFEFDKDSDQKLDKSTGKPYMHNEKLILCICDMYNFHIFYTYLR